MNATVTAMQDHHDYRRIAAAIRFLAEHYAEQPSLPRVAEEAGLSPFHFQRLFTRWAGVSPKRYLKFLTALRAKELLRGAESVLGAALEAGLSGPGRLHDLLVTVEAVTPGEWKAQGEGLALAWGIHPSPFGDCLLVVSPRGITDLVFVEGDPGAAVEQVEERWPRAELREDPERTGELLERVFPLRREPRPGEPLPLYLKGSAFQLKVWQALLAVPEGDTTTYGALAQVVGGPRAARAVGQAVGVNPVAWLIPCHRVLRTDGALGGYRYGVPRKRAMLAWEACAAAGA
jgi:AraC family transcriptional regulator of adaptative response/methylated-DNA-[protein]-cysteine methyltransferase